VLDDFHVEDDVERLAGFRERFGGDDADFIARAPAEPRSIVRFDIEPEGEVVKLTVHHSGMEPDGVILEGISGGWPQIVASLKSLLETGAELALG